MWQAGNSVRRESQRLMTTAMAAISTVIIPKHSQPPRATFRSRKSTCTGRRSHVNSSRCLAQLSRQGNGITSKAFAGTLHYMKACMCQCKSSSEEINWRHGSAAESGVGSACRPPQRSGRTVRKSAVSVKVSADGPGLLTLAVPGNQKTARGGLGGDFYAPPAHGLGRCRADRNPRVGKRVKTLVHAESSW